jgi:3-oxoacyl-[acyl-carrier-protein] synthase-3
MDISSTTPDSRRTIVRECLRRELTPDQTFPPDNEDLLESGALDSMAWVGVIRCIEAAANAPDLGKLLADQPASIASLLAAIESLGQSAHPRSEKFAELQNLASEEPTRILGWAHTLGSLVVPVTQIEKEFSLPAGKLRSRAGIESVRRAAGPENEINLAAAAARAALRLAEIGPTELDYVLATGETFAGYPSLGAHLHSRILARESCSVLDIGGACLGLINAFAVGHSLIISGAAKKILIVTADVHSRLLAPGRVVGEFGGLFGDGASAFVVGKSKTEIRSSGYHLRQFLFGCTGSYAGAIRLAPSATGGIDLHFDGEALSRAAVTHLERVIADLELRTGVTRHSAAAFATHQPNPRLLDLLARQMKVPLDKFPAVARTCGNLGAGTCGVALSLVLTAEQSPAANSLRPIFLASLGPGLLWGGGVLQSINHD